MQPTSQSSQDILAAARASCNALARARPPSKRVLKAKLTSAGAADVEAAGIEVRLEEPRASRGRRCHDADEGGVGKMSEGSALQMRSSKRRSSLSIALAAASMALKRRRFKFYPFPALRTGESRWTDRATDASARHHVRLPRRAGGLDSGGGLPK